MNKSLPLAVTLSAIFAPSAQANLEINLLHAFTSANGARNGSAEIVAYTPDQYTVLSTMSGSSGTGVQVLSLGSTGTLSERGLITFDTVFGGVADISGASSTAADPLGRGFGAVSLIPKANGTTVGKLGFFDYRDGSLGALATLDVGYHPDSIRFSADGSRLFVANEGEFTSGGNTDAPGSISIIDLSGIQSLSDFASLTSAHVKTFDFQSHHLADGLTLDGLRFNDLTATELYRHVEPEFISELDGRLYVSLQENNAIGVFDLASEKWVDLHKLGTIAQVVDASDRDGGAFINDKVAGLPMPDTIATFSSAGIKFVVTANEGDFRVDDNDRIRVKDLPAGSVDSATEAELNAIYGNYKADSALGRLRISKIDGDTDGDGKIETLTMTGTRSFSIWDAETGQLVSDSGSFETKLLELDPTLHNITGGDTSTRDARSADKGPEPEGLALGEINGRRYAFIGMERQNGLLAYDITNPEKMEFAGYINSLADGLISPESLLFIQAAFNPTGKDLLIAGYELNGGGIGVYSVVQPVPVPAALPLMASALVGVFGMSRRKKMLG
ncbi:MAG: choice-of-anchor I family protein [Methylicorpusculum sp.]|nr:choice-of-anchor I family protein [Methylicorpusculum sp.]